MQRFDALKVVSLRLLNETRRLEIKLGGAGGAEHVVSLPVSDAVELAQFISEACSFMQRLKPNPPNSAGRSN